MCEHLESYQSAHPSPSNAIFDFYVDQVKLKIYATRSVSTAMPEMSPPIPTKAFSQLVLMNNLINLVSNE
jgi:hypothetical protein